MAMQSESKRYILICPPLTGVIHRALRQLKEGGLQWAYLGEDVAKAIAVERQIGDKGQRIEIARGLQKTAHSLRQPYIDYIGKLSRKNSSISWWLGRLSEKNPYVSKTFLHLCYLKLCQTLLHSNDSQALLFLVENRALRECLVENLSNSQEYEIHHLGSLSHRVTEALNYGFKVVASRGYFIVNNVYRLLLARYYKLNQIPNGEMAEGKGLVLLHPQIDRRSFDATGEYHELDFGELAHYLRNKGARVIIVPYILDTAPYHRILKQMTQSTEYFLVPHAFLSMYDIFRLALKDMLNILKKRGYPSFDGFNISKLVMDDVRKDWRELRVASQLLFYEIVRHWKEAGIPIDRLIYPYENHVWEKAYCLALREFYPSTGIIGYQNSTLRKMLLNFFFAQEERGILPFPDKIITNGKYPERLLKESGYDPQKVVCGGAIRYESLLEEAKTPARRGDTSHPTILVTCSIDRNRTIELIWKVLKAFGQVKEYKVILKLHPVLPYNFIAADLGTLPEHFIVSDKPVGELLKECNVLLYAESTTCIEALSFGVPVVHVESDFVIDLDPLDFRPDVSSSARSKDDILKAVEEILAIDQRELAEKRAIWKEVVSEIFGPVDESGFDLFLYNGGGKTRQRVRVL